MRAKRRNLEIYSGWHVIVRKNKKNVYIKKHDIYDGARGGVVCSREVAGSIPGGVTIIFH